MYYVYICKADSSCVFVPGDATGRSDKQVGTTESAQACVDLVNVKSRWQME